MVTKPTYLPSYLEEKLNIMNVEQRGFWVEQKERKKYLTLLAIISAVFSFIAMLKSFGIFGKI